MSEHLDTKLIAKSIPSSERQCTVIFVKWRPFGSSNNRRTVDRVLWNIHISRDPLSLGEVEGVLHLPPLWSKPSKANVRSSRRGREQIRPKTSEFSRWGDLRRSDLIAGDNPYSGTREVRSLQ